MVEGSDRRANIELKARCPDRDAARAALLGLGAEDRGVEHQVDTYFSTGSYRMKLRESSRGEHRMIWYSRPDAAGSRKSSYRLMPVLDPGAKKRILSLAMGVKQVVTKDRHLFLLGPTRIHLDSVDELGSYLEFEVVLGGEVGEAEGHRIVAELREQLHVRDEDLVSRSYSDLVGDALPA
jgi:predicted adenylyl cyclase CyaB